MFNIHNFIKTYKNSNKKVFLERKNRSFDFKKRPFRKNKVLYKKKHFIENCSSGTGICIVFSCIVSCHLNR